MWWIWWENQLHDDTRFFLERRKNKAIAIILSLKERECDQYLPTEASEALRKVILDQLNDLAELAESLLDSSTILNEEYVKKIDRILERWE